MFACDLIVAAPDVTFAVTPAKLGVPYNLSGMVTFLNAATPRIVRETAFTAKPISAERAERLGMINNVVPKDELESFTMALASDIAANAPLSIAVMKEQLRILAAAKPMSPQGTSASRGCGGSSTTAWTTPKAFGRSRRNARRCSRRMSTPAGHVRRREGPMALR